jgi:hypothetical protein
VNVLHSTTGGKKVNTINILNTSVVEWKTLTLGVGNVSERKLG